MVTSSTYKNENGDDLPSFSDPEDFVDDLTDNGIVPFTAKTQKKVNF
jgi:hypothetical protein